MKPLLAHTYEPHRITFPCYVQPKLNGIRALYQNRAFQSRDEVPFPPGLLSHLAEPLFAALGEHHYPLDGELYVHGWSLQRILSAVTPVRGKPTEETPLIEYHVFDRINFDKSFEDRHLTYHQFAGHPIHWVPSYFVKNQAEADNLYSQFISQGYEGMMYRLGDCPYTKPKQPFFDHALGAGTFPSKSRFLSDKNNRCWHLLKRKDWQDDEFEILGLELTQGQKGETGFRLWCKAASGKRFAVSSGLSDKELEHYYDNQPIGRLAKVKYLVLSDENIPLNATLLAIL